MGSTLVIVFHFMKIKFQLIILVLIIVSLIQFVKLVSRAELKHARPPLIGALVCLGIAGVCSGADQMDIWCYPDSWFQGHAVWHCAASLAMVYLWRTHYLISRSVSVLEP